MQELIGKTAWAGTDMVFAKLIRKIAMAFAVLLVAQFAAAASSFQARAQNSQTSQGMLFGNADANVTIIEYASLSCPHCAHFYANVFPQIKRQYLDTGIAKLYVRDFPHNNVGLMATLTLRCAAEAVRPDLYGILLERQDSWVTKSDVRGVMREYAALAGVDAQTLDGCWQDKERIAQLFSDIKAAEEQGVSSIPTVFIGGKKIKSSFAAISKAIEAAR